MPELFDATTYRLHMDMLAAGLRVVEMVPVDELRDQLGTVETLGPILEPTAYARGGYQNLQDQRDLLEAAAAVKAALARIRARHPELEETPTHA